MMEWRVQNLSRALATFLTGRSQVRFMVHSTIPPLAVKSWQVGQIPYLALRIVEGTNQQGYSNTTKHNKLFGRGDDPKAKGR